MDPRPNYDECVQIETARCDVRETCIGNKAFDKAYPDFDRDTCVAYSKEHCRTRRITGEDWEQKDVDKCVKAILSLKQDCGRLIPKGEDETEDIGQCNFIEDGDAGLLDLKKEHGDGEDTDSRTDGDDTESDDATTGEDTNSASADAGA